MREFIITYKKENGEIFKRKLKNERTIGEKNISGWEVIECKYIHKGKEINYEEYIERIEKKAKLLNKIEKYRENVNKVIKKAILIEILIELSKK